MQVLFTDSRYRVRPFLKILETLECWVWLGWNPSKDSFLLCNW